MKTDQLANVRSLAHTNAHTRPSMLGSGVVVVAVVLVEMAIASKALHKRIRIYQLYKIYFRILKR